MTVSSAPSSSMGLPVTKKNNKVDTLKILTSITVVLLIAIVGSGYMYMQKLVHSHDVLQNKFNTIQQQRQYYDHQTINDDLAPSDLESVVIAPPHHHHHHHHNDHDEELNDVEKPGNDAVDRYPSHPSSSASAAASSSYYYGPGHHHDRHGYQQQQQQHEGRHNHHPHDYTEHQYKQHHHGNRNPLWFFLYPFILVLTLTKRLFCFAVAVAVRLVTFVTVVLATVFGYDYLNKHRNDNTYHDGTGKVFDRLYNVFQQVKDWIVDTFESYLPQMEATFESWKANLNQQQPENSKQPTRFVPTSRSEQEQDQQQCKRRKLTPERTMKKTVSFRTQDTMPFNSPPSSTSTSYQPVYRHQPTPDPRKKRLNGGNRQHDSCMPLSSSATTSHSHRQSFSTDRSSVHTSSNDDISARTSSVPPVCAMSRPSNTLSDPPSSQSILDKQLSDLFFDNEKAVGMKQTDDSKNSFFAYSLGPDPTPIGRAATSPSRRHLNTTYVAAPSSPTARPTASTHLKKTTSTKSITLEMKQRQARENARLWGEQEKQRIAMKSPESKLSSPAKKNTTITTITSPPPSSVAEHSSKTMSKKEQRKLAYENAMANQHLLGR